MKKSNARCERERKNFDAVRRKCTWIAIWRKSKKKKQKYKPKWKRKLWPYQLHQFHETLWFSLIQCSENYSGKSVVFFFFFRATLICALVAFHFMFLCGPFLWLDIFSHTVAEHELEGGGGGRGFLAIGSKGNDRIITVISTYRGRSKLNFSGRA